MLVWGARLWSLTPGGPPDAGLGGQTLAPDPRGGALMLVWGARRWPLTPGGPLMLGCSAQEL